MILRGTDEFSIALELK